MGNKPLILNQIQEYLDIHKDAEFARYLDVSPQTLSNWKKRETFDVEIIYTKCLFLNPGWIITGEGEMLKFPKKYDSTPDTNYQETGRFVLDADRTPMAKSQKLSPKTGKKLSPTLSPTHEKCQICTSKDAIITEQRERITDLKDRIEDLRDTIDMLKEQIAPQRKSAS